MNEREIYLMEMALEGELSSDEEKEFEKMINENSSIKKEFEEQKKIKGC